MNTSLQKKELMDTRMINWATSTLIVGWLAVNVARFLYYKKLIESVAALSMHDGLVWLEV